MALLHFLSVDVRLLNMEWLIYLLQVSVCTVVFFSFYLLVLRKLTFFKFNRFYLLGSLFLSFIIPSLQFEVQRKIIFADNEIQTSVTDLQPISNEPFQLIKPVVIKYQPNNEQNINWKKLGLYLYGGIASMIIIAFGWRMHDLLKYTQHYVTTNDGLKLISKNKGFTNCSFFNYVFIDENSLSEAELQVLLKHEKVHAQQLHSLDKILLMLFKSMLWFNPIVYLFDKALEQVHEYEADEITSSDFGNQAYANLLLRLAVAKSDMPLIHNFVKSPIKDRIKMLFNSKSRNLKKSFYLLTVPVISCLVWLFAVKVVYANEALPISKLKIDNSKVIDSTPAKQKVIFKKKQNVKEIVSTDTTKKMLSLVLPKINSFKKLTGDAKNTIFMMQDAVIEIKSDILRAENVEWNRKTNILIAKNSSLTNSDGNKVIASLLIYDLNKGTYRIVSEKQNFEEIEIKQEESDSFALDLKVEYKADTVKFSKSKSIIYLMGDAETSFKNTKIFGKKIIYNSQSQMLSATNATIYSKNKKVLQADSIYYNLKTSKARVFGSELNP
ncbi:M56 family metallopeptidase [Pedobacter sp. Leaf250]|uniref:M56 family metallopeptidase n=1 Tax=Pedobacter sp. Leaf250 TaxID=2876559 RepID=UPI001E45455D|nr:M56 family metallopeptidase [Pedobacter sp. Leaf250]